MRCATSLILVLSLALAAGGCEKEVDRTTQNLQGSWQGQVANAQLILNLGANGVYTIEVENASLVFTTSVWGKLPDMGLWRVAEDEIVFSDFDNVTRDGLEIVKLHDESARFKARNGAEAPFKRIATRATPAPIQPPKLDENGELDLDNMEG